MAMRRSGWVLHVGLAEGLIGSAAAIAWADRWIMALPDWPLALTEVSMPGRAAVSDAIGHIAALVGAPSDRDAFAITVALFDRAIAAPYVAAWADAIAAAIDAPPQPSR